MTQKDPMLMNRGELLQALSSASEIQLVAYWISERYAGEPAKGMQLLRDLFAQKVAARANVTQPAIISRGVQPKISVQLFSPTTRQPIESPPLISELTARNDRERCESRNAGGHRCELRQGHEQYGEPCRCYEPGELDQAAEQAAALQPFVAAELERLERPHGLLLCECTHASSRHVPTTTGGTPNRGVRKAPCLDCECSRFRGAP